VEAKAGAEEIVGIIVVVKVGAKIGKQKQEVTVEVEI
jgi:hypothetical protein